MKRTILCSIVYALAAISGPAQDKQCPLGAWVADKDKNGTNVRATPSARGAIVKLFPFAKDEGEEVMVDVVGFENGWLKIRSADTVDGTSLLTEPAWISAKLVTANVETNTGKPATLYATPSRKARKVGTIPSDTLIAIAGFDCFGFKVTYKGTTGWLSREDICGNPVTTCP